MKNQTHVAMCRIHGTTWLNMYDHAPGVADYPSDSSTTAPLGDRTLDEAKKKATFRTIDAIWRRWVEEDYVDGYVRTQVDRVELLDNRGHVVAMGTCREYRIHWDAPATIDVAAARETVAALRSEASLESSWDNYETARGLQQQADVLTSAISVAEHANRLAT